MKDLELGLPPLDFYRNLTAEQRQQLRPSAEALLRAAEKEIATGEAVAAAHAEVARIHAETVQMLDRHEAEWALRMALARMFSVEAKDIHDVTIKVGDGELRKDWN